MKLKFKHGFFRKKSLTVGFLTFWHIIVSSRLTFIIYHCTVAKRNCRLTKMRKSISNCIENTVHSQENVALNIKAVLEIKHVCIFSFWKGLSNFWVLYQKKKRIMIFFSALFFSFKGQGYNTVAQIAYDLWSPSENKNPIKSEILRLRTGCTNIKLLSYFLIIMTKFQGKVVKLCDF